MAHGRQGATSADFDKCYVDIFLGLIMRPYGSIAPIVRPSEGAIGENFEVWEDALSARGGGTCLPIPPKYASDHRYQEVGIPYFSRKAK